MICNLKNLQIESIASYLPIEKRNFHHLVEEFGEDVINHTIKHSGINSLRVANDNQTSLDMCYEASQFLFLKENIDCSTRT